MGRLDRLELENFKSYKGRQTIGPFSNFSAIMGPNGSGKSNLMDAISFVLGVKSSQLRSNQLRDLIYHNEQSQTVGETFHSASVSAVFELDSGSELVFTRRIGNSISGSEYRINGKVVPWSKYNDSLEKENILIKAKNFLVFQGDVEAIASQSPKELTKLIEQISGSLELKDEYERLKDAQEKATESSAMTFNKKKTVSAEMKQFREQKEEAEKFKLLVAKKSSLVVTHALWNLFHLEKGIKRLQSEVNEEMEIIQAFDSEKAEIDGKIKEAKKAQAKVAKDVIRIETIIKNKTQENDDKKPHLLKMEESVQHGTKKLDVASGNLADAEKTRATQSKTIAIFEKELGQLKKAQMKFEDEMKKKKATEVIVISDADMEEYHRRKRQVEQETINERQKISQIQRKVQLSRETKTRIDEKLKALRTKIQSLTTDTTACETKKQNLIDEIDRMESELTDKRRKMEQSTSEKRRLKQLEDELHEKLIDANNRLLQARVEKSVSERESKFKETLTSLKRIYPGVYGRVLDLCKPTHRKYETAVSVILGRNLDAIVVDKEKTAIECIKYMREQRAGQATFLPLDTIKVKPVNEKYRTFAKGARLALDVMEADPAVEAALQFACGNALVCDTTEIAKYICYEKRQEVKAVSLDGTVIHKTGMITGGQSTTGNSSYRWEEKEVEGLKSVRENLYQKIQETTKALRRVTQYDEISFELAGLESRTTNLKEELIACRRKMEGVEAEKSHYNEEIETLMPDLNEANTILASADEEIQGLEADIQGVEHDVFKDLCKKLKILNIRDYEEAKFRLNQEAKDKTLKFTTSIARLESQISFERQSLNDCEERIKQLTDAITKDTKALAQLQNERDSLADQQKERTAMIEKNNEALRVAKVEAKAAQERLSLCKKKMDAFDKKFEGQTKNISAKESEMNQLHAERLSVLRRCKLEEIDIPLEDEQNLNDISIDHLENRPSGEDMDINKNPSIALTDIPIDFSKLKKEHKQTNDHNLDSKFKEEIRLLSQEIDKLAPNTRAVDKLGDVQAKLKATAEEFENSRKEAKNAKEEFLAVKNERYRRFYSAFSHISDQIDRIYKELTLSKTFPLGGTAYLSLEDSDEPYLDGIKYHAMPPMKRFREMELLSGGEKTVAALALLFAIHSFQPAPFFVLDEVDAALDNTNVSKVARYIRSHATSSVQFIVISLKNTFYETAEGLVGVYKDQSEASSKVITLDLTQFEE